MRRTLGLFGLLAACAAPALAQAPTGNRMRLFFTELEGSDTAYVAVAGGTFDTRVVVQDFSSIGLGAFTFRVYFDPAQVSFVTAQSSCPDSVGSPLQAPVTGANYVELSAAGCATVNTFQTSVATIRFQVQGAATTGSSLYVEPIALADRNLVNRSGDREGDLDQVCLGVGRWGDVDDDGLVNSRDALIALSNAVGLPTGGFFVSRGDVDADGFVGSRDALAMLSVSIGYAPAGGFRTGRTIATACAGEATFTRTLYFVRRVGFSAVPGVSGLAIRSANDSATVVVGDSADPQAYYGGPRVSPNGSRVVFTCLWQGYPNICAANADGTGLTNLSQAFTYDYSPDWNWDGTQIVFVRSNQIWTMNADGTGQAPIPSTPPFSVYSVAWDPTPSSRRIAYTGSATGYHELHTRDIDSATTDSVLFVGSSVQAYPYFPDWSPAGDSLVFSLTVNGGYTTWVIGRNAGAPAPVLPLGPSPYGYRQPAWTTEGILTPQYLNYPSPTLTRLVVRRPNGVAQRVRRDTADNIAPGMDKQ